MKNINLILAQSEKGGCGKTTIVEGIVTGLGSASGEVLVVDADDGNSGYIRRAGEGSAIPLAWSLGADALPRWVDTHVAGHRTIVIDCGANIIASGAPVNEFLGELVGRVADAGGSVVALALASTNAPGTGRLVKEMRHAYGDFGEVRLIRNNQDGSGAFSRSLGTLSLKSAKFPHIQAGIQAARLQAVAPLNQVLNNPPRGFETAMAWYASEVLRFLEEPGIADLVDADALDRLRGSSAARPGILQRVVYRLEQAGNEALRANNCIYLARRELKRAAGNDRGDAQAIAQAALAMLDAETAHDALTA